MSITFPGIPCPPIFPGTLLTELATRHTYKVASVGIKDGERFYFLTDDRGTVALFPASVIEPPSDMHP